MREPLILGERGSVQFIEFMDGQTQYVVHRGWSSGPHELVIMGDNRSERRFPVMNIRTYFDVGYYGGPHSWPTPPGQWRSGKWTLMEGFELPGIRRLWADFASVRPDNTLTVIPRDEPLALVLGDTVLLWDHEGNCCHALVVEQAAESIYVFGCRLLMHTWKDGPA